MKPPDGLALLAEVRRRWPETTVVMMTAFAGLGSAREALKLGAQDYVEKEGDYIDVIARVLRDAAEKRELQRSNRSLTAAVESLRREALPVVGDSAPTRATLDLARKVAVTDSTVLLRGESGTGKDLFARTLHALSKRAGGPWVKVNCGALPEALLESELFGHEKGAFTGAVRQKNGRFEDAHGGSLFLDEIGEMPPALQVKLLQAIEEKTFTRVGGNRPITVDVRIITATNRPLEDMVKAKSFREDLFFRLNVFPIVLPPLRERRGDIPRLVQHLAEKAARRLGQQLEAVSPAFLERAVQHDWPGNVRELENVIERALIMSGGALLDGSDVFSSTREAARPDQPAAGQTLEAMERAYIVRVLEGVGWQVEGERGAAQILGLNPSTLRGRMRKLDIRRTS